MRLSFAEGANSAGWNDAALPPEYVHKKADPCFIHTTSPFFFANIEIPLTSSPHFSPSLLPHCFPQETPPAAVLLKKAAGIAKASGEPNKNKIGKVSKKQVQEIAELKMKDLNAFDTEAAMRMVEGTARSMGIEVEA